MLEAQAVAEALGVHFAIDVDAPHRGRRRSRRAQDLDAAGPRARPADGIDPMVTAVTELGDLAGSTPR